MPDTSDNLPPSLPIPTKPRSNRLSAKNLITAGIHIRANIERYRTERFTYSQIAAELAEKLGCHVTTSNVTGALAATELCLRPERTQKVNAERKKLVESVQETTSRVDELLQRMAAAEAVITALQQAQYRQAARFKQLTDHFGMTIT